MFRLFASLCLSFISMTAVAGEVITAKVEHNDKRYIVEVEVLIKANAKKVKALLTDYNRLTLLNDSIRESYIVYSLDDFSHRVFVRTEACVSFFCKTLVQVQDVEELPGNIIIATVVAEKSDFDYAHTRWKITAVGQQTRVNFNTELRPSFWIPPLIGPLLIEKKLRDEVLNTIEGLEKLAGTN